MLFLQLTTNLQVHFSIKQKYMVLFHKYTKYGKYKLKALTEDMKFHTAKDLVMASGTRDTISIEINSIEFGRRKATSCRSQFLSRSNAAACWKSSELDYFNVSLKKEIDSKCFLVYLKN